MNPGGVRAMVDPGNDKGGGGTHSSYAPLSVHCDLSFTIIICIIYIH